MPMQLVVDPDKQRMGLHAAEHGAELIRQAIKERGEARVIVATGASQFEMLSRLVLQPDVRWDKVVAFHLDEYLGIEITHPASFRKYLWERFVSKLPLPIKAFHYLDAEGSAERVKAMCASAGEALAAAPIDVAFVGIGENAHLAFNDPPADFDTDAPYLVVNLDEACRRQQMGEGWFPTLEDVPTQAVSMSVRQIMKSRHIVCTVPDERKSDAVQRSVEGPVSPAVPASILQTHTHATLFLDQPAASRLATRSHASL